MCGWQFAKHQSCKCSNVQRRLHFTKPSLERICNHPSRTERRKSRWLQSIGRMRASSTLSTSWRKRQHLLMLLGGGTVADNIHRYKHVRGHPVKTAILIPKDVESVIHPLLVNIHGGLFAAGHSLFAPFWPPWILDLAVEQGAVVASPDFQLLPTANGIADVCQDLEEFWTWLNEKLPKVLQRRFRGHAVDYSKLLLIGCSTGGYGAMKLALSHPQDMAVLALAYPSIDLQSALFTSGPQLGHRRVLGFPSDKLPSLQECLSWIVYRRGTTTTKDGFDPMFLAASLIDHGLYDRTMLFPKDYRSFEHLPLERIKSGAKLPKYT